MKPVMALVELQPESRLASHRPAQEIKKVRHPRAGEKANIKNPTPASVFGRARLGVHGAKR
jgi:hypothetical protein